MLIAFLAYLSPQSNAYGAAGSDVAHSDIRQMIDVRLIDVRGNILPTRGWGSRARLRWTGAGDEVSLRYELYLKAPSNIRTPSDSTQEEKFKTTRNYLIWKTHHFETTSLTVELENKDGSLPVNILISPVSSEPLLAPHPDCEKLGVRAQLVRSRKIEPPVIGVHCLPSNSGATLRLITQNPVEIFKESGLKQLGENTFELEHQSGRKAGAILKIGESAIRISTDARFRARAENAGDGRQVSRTSWSTGASGTYLAYREEPGAVRTTQMALTGKLAATYALIPGKFDLGGNVFGTLIPVMTSRSSEAHSAARYVGLNARIGYRLPFGGRSEWWLLGGWYFWGMHVSSATYGLSMLSGPQVFLTTRQFLARTPFSFYLKLAPIAAGSDWSFSQREFAFGCAVAIGRSTALSLDFSDARFKATDYDNNGRLNTLSLGLSFNL